MARLVGGVVVGIDLSQDKLDLVERYGAQAVAGGELSSVDPEFWPTGPPTAVIDLVGSNDTLAWSAAALAPGGRLVVVNTPRESSLLLAPRDLVFREFAVLGSRYARRSEIAVAADLVGSGRIRPVSGQLVEPSGVPEVHAAIRAGSLLGRGAVRWS